VCIAGGGFGGLYAALRLGQLAWPDGSRPEVTLVDRNSRFLFKPLLYELLSGGAEEAEVAPKFADLLRGSGASFVRGELLNVGGVPSPSAWRGVGERGRVSVLPPGDGAIPLDLPYDYLLLSLGAEPAALDVPGVREHAVPFSSLEDAREVQARLEALEGLRRPVKVVLVGGGESGVELAVTVAERLRGRGTVLLVCSGDDILSGAPRPHRDAAWKQLSALGVDVLLRSRVEGVREAIAGLDEDLRPGRRYRVAVSGEALREERGADLLLWTAGQRAATSSAETGHPLVPFCPCGPDGRILVEPSLCVQGLERIFAVGDAVAAGDASRGDAPMTAQVAMQQSEVAAWNIWSSINGQPPVPFRYQHLGNMMGFGRDRGAVTLPLGEGLTLDGEVGGFLRKVAYLYRMPTNEQRLKILSNLARKVGAAARAPQGQ